MELPQSPATVRAHREEGRTDRRSSLLGVLDEHDVAERSETKGILGFEEGNDLTPVPPQRGGVCGHRLQICLARRWRTSVAGGADENGRISKS